MSEPVFARARNEAQRSARRNAILVTAASMLDEMRVADVTLNELARRVNLAKSNVLRYFESREAVLLELYDREFGDWLDALEEALEGERHIEPVASAVAFTAAERPRFCELSSAASGVLEHNVSGEVAASYKRAALEHSARLARLTIGVGDLTDPRAAAAVGAINLIIAGMWAASRPSPGMAVAYRENPDLRSMQIDFSSAVRELVATVLVGLEHRTPRA